MNMMSRTQNERLDKERLVVVGNGMVGQRFCEKLVELDVDPARPWPLVAPW